MNKSSDQLVLEVRRELHRIPELAFHEIKTKNYIKKFVSEHANNFQLVNEGKGGLIFKKINKHSTSKKLWRAELDGLPLKDQKEVGYASINTGRCHSCGHDAHMSILLLAMKELNKKETATIYCSFQSGEEVFAGARYQVEYLKKNNIIIDEAYSLHVNPNLELDCISTSNTILLAQSDLFHIILEFPEGHIANGADYTEYLFLIKTTIEKSLTKGSVVCVTGVSDNAYYNIAPSQLSFNLMIRTKEYSSKQIFSLVKKIIAQKSNSTRITIQKFPTYKKGINSPNTSAKLSEVTTLNNVNLSFEPFSYSSDDFSFYQDIATEIHYFFLGCKSEKTSQCHTESFDLDESCLKVGLQLCIQLLQK
ncbi:M20/M25/M40 family metallo-hydrolase [Erwinia sp. CPCC 100877]|nr:M20/M25/M40 family metallo-hydrolase [Erwinia sp. CPCC 100877]